MVWLLLHQQPTAQPEKAFHAPVAVYTAQQREYKKESAQSL